MLRKAVTACLLLLSAACTQLPSVEFQAYRDSFAAAQTAAQPMIADYAVAERESRVTTIKTARGFTTARPYFPTFHANEDPAALSTIGLPPGASAVQRAFQGIEAYNNTLAALAENRNVDEARGQLRQIVADVGSVVPGSESGQAVANAVSGLVVSLFQPAIAADNRVQFKRIVIDGFDPMINLIGLLRTHSEDQYATTITPILTRIQNNQGDRAEQIARINAWHRVFADYVVLLDAMKLRLTDLKEAAESPRPQAFLARASAGAADLRAYADGLRASLATLRQLP